MARRLATWSLLGALALLPSGCVVLDATTVGFAMATGQRLVTVSGEAKWARPQQTVTAVNLVTGDVVAQGKLDDQKRFSVRVSLPLSEDLAIALHAPGSAALLLTPRSDKRQEDRTLDLTRGSTTVAWALGSALGGLTLPGNDSWNGKPEQWKKLAERLPVARGIAVQASANTLDTVGVGSPSSTASELSRALSASLEAIRVASGGHPRDHVLWPAVILGWTNALGGMAPSTGDAMAPQAASAIDLRAMVDQIWATSPHAEEQGAIEVKVPLKETGTNRVPEALPAVIHGLRYQISASMLSVPRAGTIPREAVRFQSGAAVLRVPDMPEGFASIDIELLGENTASLGTVTAQGVVNRAIIRQVEAKAIEVSLEGTPTTRPGVR